MNPTPKTLQVFLPEGTPAGIQIAELTTRIVPAISVRGSSRATGGHAISAEGLG